MNMTASYFANISDDADLVAHSLAGSRDASWSGAAKVSIAFLETLLLSWATVATLRRSSIIARVI